MSDLEISPPPRSKRNSLQKKSEEPIAKNSANSIRSHQTHNNNNANKKFVKSASSNVITTGHYKVISNNGNDITSNTNHRLPPPHPNIASHTATNNWTPCQNPVNDSGTPGSKATLSADSVRKCRKNSKNENEEHIYECLEIKRPPLSNAREGKQHN